jgi:hypothetical protein
MERKRIKHQVHTSTYDNVDSVEIDVHHVVDIKRHTKTYKGTKWTEIIYTLKDGTVDIITFYHAKN